MTVTEFIPVGDAKLVIEKTEKPKPRRHAPRPKKEPSSIGEPEKDSILIITEKPQAADKIAHALGSPKKHFENNVSYYELERNREKIIVASAVGHLFNLTYAEGQKGWPIFKIEWVPSFKSKQASFTKRYYDLPKKLARKAKNILIATDYDIEGEVIGWNILRFICKKETAKRMKYSTLTKDELEKSYENPMPEVAWGQAYAGEPRHILDWLYGINLSRALMSAIKKTGSFRIMSIGRVQGPTLKIIVEREREIEGFKSEKYWQAFALTNGNSQESPSLSFKHPRDIFNSSSIEIFKGIEQANAETKDSRQTTSPPVPFDLTTLQREAYKFHKINPSQALSIAQKLYLEGLISYPRISSQKIPEAIEPRKIL